MHDFATAIHSAGPELAVTKIYENIVLWKQAKSYRDKVLAVFAEVLNYILNDGLQSTHPSSPELTKYGNNRLSGDVGDLSTLTVSTLVKLAIMYTLLPQKLTLTHHSHPNLW